MAGHFCHCRDVQAFGDGAQAAIGDGIIWVGRALAPNYTLHHPLAQGYGDEVPGLYVVNRRDGIIIRRSQRQGQENMHAPDARQVVQFRFSFTGMRRCHRLDSACPKQCRQAAIWT